MFQLLIDLLYAFVYFALWRPCKRLVRKCQRGPFRRPRPRQPPGASGLLQLPVELVLAIVDALPAADRVFLAHTCHPLHTLLQAETAAALQAVRELPLVDRIAFLTTAAHDQVDRWCCEACVALHPALVQDQYNTWMHINENIFVSLGYPSRHDDLYARWIFRGTEHHPASSCVKHRHVQLALKYARMQREGDQG